MDVRGETSGIQQGAEPPDDCLLLIFGASGNLAARELFPALYELEARKLLPEHFAVLGAARTEWSDDEFRDQAKRSVKASCTYDADTWERLAERLFYQPADFDAPPEKDYATLGERIGAIREELGIPDNLLCHLAVPPPFFGDIVHHLAGAGLAHSDDGWRRVIVEKPFGEDRESAEALNAELLDVYGEEQIYRIDHFLGKETVQNMLVFRFGNPGFEPIWNRNYIDHVQITVAEQVGIEDRAGFYERTGVVRDMIQNHLLQLLCMTAIEPPGRYAAESVRDETAKVLEAVRPIDPADAVRGQYGAGLVDGEQVVGYRQEHGVAKGSTTNTFVAAKLAIDNWRWEGVPFYLRTGKRMERKLTEVTIHFKPTPHLMFPASAENGRLANVLAFRLQPNAGILQTFAAKQPGPDLKIRPVQMQFRYDEAFGVKDPPRAYAWLFLDAMQGDQLLFARADWIDHAWDVVDPLVTHWAENPPDEVPNYAAGTWGPPEAAALMARDQRRWGTY
jgi:glucose-6-phosphate 1-dehydrogenase